MREGTWRAPKITHAWMAIQTLALLALVFVPLAPDRSRLVPAPVDGDQGEAAAQVVAVERSKGALELADAGDDLHTKLWFWQSAMGYTDNATITPHKRTPTLVAQVAGQGMTDVREVDQTPVLMPKHLLAAMSAPNEHHKSAWPKRCTFCREAFWHGPKPYQAHIAQINPVGRAVSRHPDTRYSRIIDRFSSGYRTLSGGTQWVKAPTHAPRPVLTAVYGWSFTAPPSSRTPDWWLAATWIRM